MALGANTVGKKLFWAIALPALLVAMAGVVFFWSQTDRAVRASTQDEADALAELISTTFTLTGSSGPGKDDERSGAAHRSVTEVVRSHWKMFRYVSDLRILDRRGVVRWSRRIEEEGKTLPDAARLLSVGPETHSGERGAEVVRPLGGMACAGCHPGEATMKAGVLQLTIDQTALKAEVRSVFEGAMSSLLGFAALLSFVTALSLRVYLTRPLSRLAEAMRQAEEGDFLARAPLGGSDEIGALSKAFNRMLARITAMKVEEIDTHRDLAEAQEQLSLKQALGQTNATLERRVTELSTLYDVARSLTSTLELPELFERISALVPERLGIPRFSIMLPGVDRKLEVQSAHPRGHRAEGVSFAIGEGICGLAAQTQKAVYVPDLDADVRFRARSAGAARGDGSLLSVPMVHRGELLGVLNFERPEKAAFSAEEIEFLNAVADQAAMAVKNARLHETTVELSITDPLTGVPNRRHLFTRLEMEVARANRFGNQVSMLMVDIDHFKLLNDTAGHRAGDMVLRRVCELMKGAVRKVDTLARYGGEEFVVLLPQVTKSEALEVADKLRRAVSETLFPEAHAQPGGRITISVGVSNLPVDSTEQDHLVDCADSALYASKRGGRDKVTGYSAGMELHPGRERGPHAVPRGKSGEFPAIVVPKG